MSETRNFKTGKNILIEINLIVTGNNDSPKFVKTKSPNLSYMIFFIQRLLLSITPENEQKDDEKRNSRALAKHWICL